MKRLGMIGGGGWPSTLEYYRLLNTYYSEMKGPGHSLDLVLRNLDFVIFRELITNGQRDQALEMLVDGVNDCKNAGAEFVIFSSNALHGFLDELGSSISLPVIHIAEATAKVIADKGLRKAGLLGVKLTMEGKFYPDILGKYGIETLIPNESDRGVVEQIIFSELVNGKTSRASKEVYLEVMQRLVNEGAEGIILGCTEIPLLIKEEDTEYPQFSTTEIHCRAALQFALE
jgi:aspartate racemase